MANTASMPAEGQILVNIEDMSLLKDIKKAISMVKGVGKITVPRRRMTSYERSLDDEFTRRRAQRSRQPLREQRGVFQENGHLMAYKISTRAQRFLAPLRPRSYIRNLEES